MNKELSLTLASQINLLIDQRGQFFVVPIIISSGESLIVFRQCLASLVVNSIKHQNSFTLPILAMRPFENTQVQICFAIKDNCLKIQELIQRYSQTILTTGIKISDQSGAEIKFRQFINQLSVQFHDELKSILLYSVDTTIDFKITFENSRRFQSTARFSFTKMFLFKREIDVQIQNFFGKIVIDTISTTDPSISKGIGSSKILI